MKQKASTIERFSIKEIEPLIKSIEDAKDITEELICKELGYNEGYISQLRSREKSTGVPQVSPKFYKQLKVLQLQNAKNGIENKTTEPSTLAEALEIIKQQNAFLQDLVKSNLAALSMDVNNNSAAIRAEIRGYGKYQILKQSNWDDQEFAKAMAVVYKIYGEELKVDDGRGNLRT